MAPDPDRHQDMHQGVDVGKPETILNEGKHQTSFPQLKYPPYRDEEPRSGQQFLMSKRALDGAEGLWRVHNGIYDLEAFVGKHPGGRQWLELTKGTDVTELFETHHVKGTAEPILAKYYVRKAQTPRNSPFTFEADGFYKTLKAKIVEKLKEVPEDEGKKSDVIANVLIVALLAASPLAVYVWSNIVFGLTMMLVTGLLLGAMTVCAHNYVHRADNWRMYLFTFSSGIPFSEWRVTHSISHHMHTNTIHDIELSEQEPFMQFLPLKDKPFIAQLAGLYSPLIYPICTLVLWGKSIFNKLTGQPGYKISNDLLMPFALPAWMWLASGFSLLHALPVWMVIQSVHSIWFMVFGLTAGHHGHTNFFEGDVPRAEHLDWGIHQMDTVVEREELVGNLLKTLVTFGDHALHHLFPTLDHAVLPYLYPTFMEHLDKFGTELRTTSTVEAFFSQAKQLIRKRPNNFKYKGKSL